jgi:predicted outer membrane repeat protein
MPCPNWHAVPVRNIYIGRSSDMRNDTLVLLNLASGVRRLIAQSVMILLLFIGLSSCDGMGEMYDDLTQKVPICVDLSSTAVNPDGRGWKNAYKTIQDAITNAPAGSEIWIKKGTYNIPSAITIVKNISLYGGFDGNESRRDDRSSDSSLTVITASSVLTYNIPNNNGSKNESVIDGVTFTNGSEYAISIGGYSSVTIRNSIFSNITTTGLMGAIYNIEFADLVVSKCTFINNKATNGVGGAIYIIGSHAVKISNSTFTGNSALEGGAIVNIGTANVTISKSTFTNNSATISGGAITNFGDGVFAISGSTFTNNSANAGGAISHTGTVTLSISDSTFVRNYASGAADVNGGAIYCNNSGPLNVSDTIFGDKDVPTGNENHAESGGAIYSRNCEINIQGSFFYSNSTVISGGRGGAMFLTGWKPNYIGSCSFIGNKALNSYGGAIWTDVSGGFKIEKGYFQGNTAEYAGGGLYLGGTGIVTIISGSLVGNNVTGASGYGGAIAISDSKTVEINTSQISGNTTVNRGGGIHHFSSQNLIIQRTIISGNIASSPTSEGGGLYHDNGTISIYNSLIYNNSAIGGSSQIYCGSSFTATNCTIIGNGTNIGYLNQGTITNCVLFNGSVDGTGSDFYNTGTDILTLVSTPKYTITSSAFTNFASQNYRPSSSSPLMNNGTTVSDIGTLDLDGNPRVRGAIDIGAYEVQ